MLFLKKVNRSDLIRFASMKKRQLCFERTGTVSVAWVAESLDSRCVEKFAAGGYLVSDMQRDISLCRQALTEYLH